MHGGVRVAAPGARVGDVDEQRRIRGHDDDIGIALESGHVGGVAERALEIGGGGIARDTGGPLALENLGLGAVVAIVFRGTGVRQNFRPHVKVMVLHVADAVRRAGRTVALDGGINELQFGILGLDGIVELLEAPVVVAAPVLVADFNVGERERGGVAVLRALRAPFGVHVAGDVFDFVEGILHVRFQIRAGGHFAIAEGEARKHREQGLHFQIFAPVEKLQQAQAVGSAVIPGAGVAGALGDVADGFFPVEPVGHAVALEEIAAGKAQEGRVVLGQQLHDVRAIAIRAVVVGGREQRHQAEPGRAGRGCPNQEIGVLGRLDRAVGFQRDFIFLPGAGQLGHGGKRIGYRLLGARDGDGQWPGEIAAGLGIKRRAVGGVRAHGDAPKAFIGHTHAHFVGGGGGGELQADGQLVVILFGGVEIKRAAGAGVLHERPALEVGRGVLKGAVGDEFAIQAAVIGIVYLLGHESIENRAGVGHGLAGINGDGGDLCGPVGGR